MSAKGPDRVEQAILAAFLALAGLLAWLDHRSTIALLLRNSSAVVERFDTDASRFLAIYQPQPKRLYVLQAPANWSDETLDAVATIHFRAPAALAAHAHDALELRDWLAAQPRDLRGVWRIFKNLGAAAPSARLTRYDVLLLRLEMLRVEPESIRADLAPAKDEIDAYLAWRIGAAPLEKAKHASVELLNASSENGVALQATKVLRLRSVDVIDFRNAAERDIAFGTARMEKDFSRSAGPSKTQVIDHAGSEVFAASVVSALGCPDVPVTTQLDRRHHAEATMILGEDFRRCSKITRAGE